MRFPSDARDRLQASGWTVADVPSALTLTELRETGLPFKGDKFFRQHAPRVQEVTFPGGEVAYRPGLMPGSLNQTYAACETLLSRLSAMLPGCEAMCASAAVYAWLLSDHFRRTDQWLIQGCYTWAADVLDQPEPREVASGDSARMHLVVGVFGAQRPLIISPAPEGRGSGVGVMPVVVPAHSR